MNKTLDEWLQQLDADPESLIPILATAEGRQAMQVTSLAITVPNVMAAMQRNGASFLEAAHRTAPLLKTISWHAAARQLTMNNQPELLWAWWLAKNDATQLALDNWQGASASKLLRLAFDWTWLHHARFGYPFIGQGSEPVQGLDTLLQALSPTERLPFQQLLAMHKKPDLDTPEYFTAQRHWRVASKAAQTDMLDFIPRMEMPPVNWASLAMFECAQRSTQENLLAFVQACPTRLHWRETDFTPHQRMLNGPWQGPLGGFALLAGTPLLHKTSLLNDPETSRLASSLEGLGVDFNDTALVTQVVATLIAPKEIISAPSEEMGALFGAD